MNNTQQLLKQKRQDAYKLAVEINTLVSWLQQPGACDHSETEEYPWGWDSGYGVQRKKFGKRCTFCGFLDIWNRGNFSNPSEIDA